MSEELAVAVDRGARALSIGDDATLVLAVSGGPDSMALLHGAATLVADGARRWRLTVAHLDHALRPDSAADAAFVAEVASALGLPCSVERRDVRALASSWRIGVEEAGREARYRFLDDVAAADALVATAHTADDAAETVLLNLVRGSGLRGARGIPARRGRVVRPLLGARREALRAMLDRAGLAYRLDPSNVDPTFLRNRVRAELLPILDELRAGAVDAIGRFSRLAADDDDLLERLANDELERRRGSDGSLDWHDPPPAALGRRVLRLAIGDPAPAAERVEALLTAAEGPRGGVAIELGDGRTATVQGRRITLR
jgi:tRNA(Ile)-lysidine synthase